MRLRGASSRGRLSRVDPEAKVLSSLDVQSARAAIRGSRLPLPGRRPGRSGNSLQSSGVDARAGRAIRISAHRRVGLTLNRDSTRASFLNPQERHNVFPQEKRRIRPHMTAEMAAGRHSRVPANLTELGVLAAPSRVGEHRRLEPESPPARRRRS